MRKLLVLFCAVLALSSCKSSYFQFYDVESNLQEKDSQYVYENDDCSVSFNFWESKGDASFLFHNKTDQNLYIPLNMSSFVFNGLSKSMYEKSELSVVVTRLSTKTIHSQPVVCVAPHSSVVLYDTNIIDRVYVFCDLRKDNPKHSYSVNFSEDDSPIKFDYYISYSHNVDCKNALMVSANFYVSKIENKNYKLSTTRSNVSDCITYMDRETIFINGGSATRFYIEKANTKPLFGATNKGYVNDKKAN